MTRTKLVAALFISAILAGCQDNSITDPATGVPDAPQSRAIVDPFSASGKIILSGTVGAEGSDQKELEHLVVGQIAYRIFTAPGKKLATRIGLEMEAELIQVLEGSSVKVAMGSVDELTFSDKAGEQLDKRYRIPSKIGVIYLHVRLTVARDGATLDRMWIERHGFGDRDR